MKQPITEEQWRVMRGWCSLLVLNDCMHPEVHKRFRGPAGCEYETCPILAEMREKGSAMEQEEDGNKYIDIVFDGPPANESGRFIEVEDENGHGLSFGEWVERPDGYWALRIRRHTICWQGLPDK